MSAETSAVTLTVARTDQPSGFASYTVPAGPTTRVLDCLLHVRHNTDPSFAFRYACRVGMCGSCAVVINGKEALACQTTIESLGTSAVKVEPLRALPVQRDLMVDLEPFFATITRAQAALKPRNPKLRDTPTIPPGTPRRMAIEQQNGCITCGACYSACEWSSTHGGYLGPAALNRILMLALDERDALGKDRLKTAAQDRGALRCHTMGSCAAVCPAEIPLRTGMQRLKGLLAAADL